MAEQNTPNLPALQSKVALAKRLPALMKQAALRLRERATTLTSRLDRETLMHAGALASSAIAVAWAVYVELKRAPSPAGDPAGAPAAALPASASQHRVLVTEYVRSHSRTTHRIGPDYEETVVELTLEALRFVSVEAQGPAASGPAGPAGLAASTPRASIAPVGTPRPRLPK